MILTASVSGESMISSLWNKIKSKQVDRSKQMTGVTMVKHGPFHYYKLTNDGNNVESNHTKPQELADGVVKQEKDLLYGQESPLRDDAVAAAWKRVEQAEERLQRHREYMKAVQHKREELAESKGMSGRIDVTQTGE